MGLYRVEYTLTVEVAANDRDQAVEIANEIASLDDAYVYVYEEIY